MLIGIPKEIKPLEGRVVLVPDAVHELVQDGHRVLVETGAGQGSGYADQAYRAAGAEIAPDAAALYAAAELLLKVKEPVAPEIDYLRPEQRLFSFLHLAAEPELSKRLCEIGLTAIAFETVADRGGLPILAPMSRIAGRIAVQVGTHLLHSPSGGRGILLGGLGSVGRGKVVILGAGQAGGNAARLAAAMGANVTVFDKDLAKLDRFHDVAPNIEARYPYPQSVDRALAAADLLIGAILVPGAETPHLISRAQVAAMRDGSVIIDISVDQGGCIETIRPTTYADPTYVEQGVLHFGVTNMPGAVPRTASQALSAAVLPYVKRLATPDWRDFESLAQGVNVEGGKLVHPALL